MLDESYTDHIHGLVGTCSRPGKDLPGFRLADPAVG